MWHETCHPWQEALLTWSECSCSHAQVLKFIRIMTDHDRGDASVCFKLKRQMICCRNVSRISECSSFPMLFSPRSGTKFNRVSCETKGKVIPLSLHVVASQQSLVLLPENGLWSFMSDMITKCITLAPFVADIILIHEMMMRMKESKSRRYVAIIIIIIDQSMRWAMCDVHQAVIEMALRRWWVRIHRPSACVWIVWVHDLWYSFDRSITCLDFPE